MVERAQMMAMQTGPATDNTLILLAGLMRTAAQLPGRKIVFVISDGFYLNDRKSGAAERIKRITNAAGLYQVRVGVRDLKSDRIGSAMQRVEVPNIPAR